MKERKMSSHICYRKTDVVYYLLHSRLWPVTLEKWNFDVFQFSFKKDMLKLTEKSCEIYCRTMYAYFMIRTQVINRKLHISEVSFQVQSFTI